MLDWKHQNPSRATLWTASKVDILIKNLVCGAVASVNATADHRRDLLSIHIRTVVDRNPGF